MTESRDYHMSWDDFHHNGQALLDWLIEYHRKLEQLPVQSQLPPGHIRAALPQEPPAKGESFKEILPIVSSVR